MEPDCLHHAHFDNLKDTCKCHSEAVNHVMDSVVPKRMAHVLQTSFSNAFR